MWAFEGELGRVAGLVWVAVLILRLSVTRGECRIMMVNSH